ncbi:MAG: BlaI/MecI/CopY family transcriptional regulator [Actinobacteria bacterium]|nr:BlaI/MecI/CopY family transcriptional regulator [Actinomycetota bacterium]
MPQLGALETKVMDALWTACCPVSVRDVHEALGSSDLAYTTILTVLDRLAKKLVVLRERDGKAWLYRPAGTREELLAQDIVEALRQEGVDVELLAEALAAHLTPAEKGLLRSRLAGT